MATAQRGKCLYRVREVESPIHKVFRGLRIEVTIPNQVGHKPWSDKTTPSFDKPYRVCQFGDYETWEALQAKWPQICQALFRMGFQEIIEYKPKEADEPQDQSQIAGVDTDEEA